MEENKTTTQTENTPEIETKVNDTNEAKTATDVKKPDLKKYFTIFAIAFLTLAMIAAAVVLIVILGKPEPEPEAEEPVSEILMEDLSQYVLVCAAGTSGKTLKEYWNLQDEIKKLCGEKIVAETDKNIEASDFEILVGNTDREESKAFLSNLLWDDYGYAIIGNKIVIAGHTADGTTNAMKHFIDHIKNGDHTTLFFSNQNQYLFRYPYISDNFMLNGIDVSRAKIVLNEESGSDAQIAQNLSNKCLEVCGRRPQIVADFDVKEGDPLIIVGLSSWVPDKMQNEWDASYATTEGKSAYYVGKEGNVVWIYTSVMEGYGAINRDLLPQIQAEDTTKVELTTGLFQMPQDFSVMSFNVYVSDFNTARANRVVDTILENMPTIFGVQEANDNWMTTLRGKLGEFYSSVGVGRDSNLKGEYSAIFYRTDKFDLIDSGTKWLSNTPDEAGSYYSYTDSATGTTYRANCPRILTYAVLERKTDGVRFLYVNTHLDHNGSNNSVAAENIRQGQIEILLAQIEQISSQLGELPTIVTGDFNVSPEASAYTTMIAGGYLDSSRVAWAGEVQPTYNGMNEGYAGAIIDYMFVSPNLAQAVDTYLVCPAKRDGEWVSDHNAIIATITLPVSDAE